MGYYLGGEYFQTEAEKQPRDDDFICYDVECAGEPEDAADCEDIYAERRPARLGSARALWLIPACLCAFCAVGGELEYIDRDALLSAIRTVESDNGATSRNVYQITRVYWSDVNRFMRWNWHPSSYRDMVETRAIAAEYVLAYWDYYGDRWQRATGHPITAEVLAKLHRVGYVGLNTKKKTAEAYWRRVQKLYQQIINRR